MFAFSNLKTLAELGCNITVDQQYVTYLPNLRLIVELMMKSSETSILTIKGAEKIYPPTLKEIAEKMKDRLVLEFN